MVKIVAYKPQKNSILNTVSQFGRTRVADTEGSHLTINRSAVFKSRALMYAKQMAEINTVTFELQKRELDLSECQYLLDELNDAVETSKDDIESPLYGCLLGTHYTSSTASIVKNPAFETGVVKIQHNELNKLTKEEERACKCLMNEQGTASTIPANS